MPQDVTDPIKIDEPAPLILDISHRGDDHFSVKISDVSGRFDERLVNTIGDFEGRVITPVKSGRYVFEVDYGLEYSIEPTGIDSIEEAPLSLSRTDPYVVPIEINSPISIEISTFKEDHVGATLRNAAGEKVERIANEIGPTNTTAMIKQTGQAFIFFDIRGDWEAEINEI